MEEAIGKIDIVAEDLGTLTPDVTELMAVSYTHLDVYKRQALHQVIELISTHLHCLTSD